MSERPPERSLPLWAGCILAPAFGSIPAVWTIMVGSSLLGGAAPFGDSLPFLFLLSAAAYAISLVALVVFGLPLTLLLGRTAYSGWWIVIGLVAGALIAWLIGTSFEAMLPPPSVDERPLFDGLAELSALPGGATGFFWALLARKRVIQLQEESFDDPPESYTS